MLDGVNNFLLPPSLMMLMWLDGCVVVVFWGNQLMILGNNT
jgi:hypothetical protein